MAKQRGDEGNTLYVIGMPDGSIKIAVSIFKVNQILDTLELNVRLRIENGKECTPDMVLNLIRDAQKDIKSMRNPLEDES